MIWSAELHPARTVPVSPMSCALLDTDTQGFFERVFGARAHRIRSSIKSRAVQGLNAQGVKRRKA